jgi:hypothetical protein
LIGKLKLFGRTSLPGRSSTDEAREMSTEGIIMVPSWQGARVFPAPQKISTVWQSAFWLGGPPIRAPTAVFAKGSNIYSQNIQHHCQHGIVKCSSVCALQRIRVVFLFKNTLAYQLPCSCFYTKRNYDWNDFNRFVINFSYNKLYHGGICRGVQKRSEIAQYGNVFTLHVYTLYTNILQQKKTTIKTKVFACRADGVSLSS